MSISTIANQSLLQHLYIILIDINTCTNDTNSIINTIDTINTIKHTLCILMDKFTLYNNIMYLPFILLNINHNNVWLYNNNNIMNNVYNIAKDIKQTIIDNCNNLINSVGQNTNNNSSNTTETIIKELYRYYNQYIEYIYYKHQQKPNTIVLYLTNNINDNTINTLIQNQLMIDELIYKQYIKFDIIWLISKNVLHSINNTIALQQVEQQQQNYITALQSHKMYFSLHIIKDGMLILHYSYIIQVLNMIKN